MNKYGQIYDQVFTEHSGYQSQLGSPGFRLCLENRAKLKQLGPRYLDYGCGAGFAVELMGSYLFGKQSHGADVSRKMAEAANSRFGMKLVHLIEDGRTAFENSTFDIVTCFDVLEHLDVDDIHATKAEIFRVLKPGGTFFCNISLRLSGTYDFEGRDLHRTVEKPDWWDTIFDFDEFTVTKEFMELTGWKRRPASEVTG
jgi:SAM-dependent methyltransferase